MKPKPIPKPGDHGLVKADPLSPVHPFDGMLVEVVSAWEKRVKVKLSEDRGCFLKGGEIDLLPKEFLPEVTPEEEPPSVPPVVQRMRQYSYSDYLQDKYERHARWRKEQQ